MVSRAITTVVVPQLITASSSYGIQCICYNNSNKVSLSINLPSGSGRVFSLHLYVVGQRGVIGSSTRLTYLISPDRLFCYHHP